MYFPEWFGTGLAGASIGLVVSSYSIQKKLRAARKRAQKAAEASQTIDFPYYPGEPQGYLHFTDRCAMDFETDKAMPQDLRERLRLIAFGHAFLQVIQARPFSGSLNWDQRQTLPCSGSPEDLKWVEWLLTMQSEGTDNAGPSTAMLAERMRDLAAALDESDPEYRASALRGNTVAGQAAASAMYLETMI